jgi:hypothetical protein
MLPMLVGFVLPSIVGIAVGCLVAAVATRLWPSRSAIVVLVAWVMLFVVVMFAWRNLILGSSMALGFSMFRLVVMERRGG